MNKSSNVMVSTLLFYLLLCCKSGIAADDFEAYAIRPGAGKTKDFVKVQKPKDHARNRNQFERKYSYNAYSIKDLPNLDKNLTFDSGENKRIKRALSLNENGSTQISSYHAKKRQNSAADLFFINTFTSDSDLYVNHAESDRSTSSSPYYTIHGEYILNRQVTLDDAQLFLLQEFLDNFTDKMQIRIVREHLYFCPYTSLCNFSFGLSVDNGYMSPCGACSCSKDCDSTNSCCPDIIDFTNTSSSSSRMATTPSNEPECLDLSLKGRSGQSAFLTISKCPEADETGQRSHHLCIQDSENKVLEDVMPVTDMSRNITYKNKHCAICHGAPEESLASWQPNLTCFLFEGKPHTYGSESELIQFVLESEACNLIFSPPSGILSASNCEQKIESCNQTGRWYSFDTFLFSACLLYENTYTIPLVTSILPGPKVRRYRNLFCALCNGEMPREVLFHGVSRNLPLGQAYPFTGLLKFESRAEDTTDPAESRCERGFIYDTTTESCLELTCSDLRTLKNNACVPMFSRIHGVNYILTGELYQVGGEERLDDLIAVYWDVKNEVDHKVSQWLSVLDLGSRGSCSMAIFHSDCSKMDCSSKDFDHYKVEFKFKILKWHSLDDIVLSLGEIENIRFNISVGKKDYSFQLQARDFGKHEYSYSQIYSSECTVASIELSKQKVCPLLAFSLEDSDCFEHKAGLYCPTLNITFYTSDYYFDSNFSNVFVCFDVYVATLTNQAPRKNLHVTSSHESVVLSLVCTIISLICLALSFAIFCLFPVLRTLPGKNNMALIVSLILAQCMFLISSFGYFKHEPVACKTVGVLTHFSWLLAIFWMNICTFHVFRVFTGFEILSVQSESKTFSVYFMYTITLSISLIITNIVVSLFLSEMNEFGYGKISCYISSEKMVAFTFGIPVGLVIITNLVMFVLSAIKIKRAPAVQKDVKNERNDIIIFTKLSTLTGFTWIFGFIYSWTDTEVFSYLFILLNASQGIFLFLSFVCNKRVFDMFKKRSFCVTSAVEAYRTRLTDSKQSAVKGI